MERFSESLRKTKQTFLVLNPKKEFYKNSDKQLEKKVIVCWNVKEAALTLLKLKADNYLVMEINWFITYQ